MPRKNLIRSFRNLLGFNTNTKSLKGRRPAALLMAGIIAVTAAVAFSISVESRNGGWLRKVLQAESKSSTSPVQKPSDGSKNTAAAPISAVNNPYFTLSPASPLAPIVTATKTDALQTDVDMDGKADPGDTLRYTVVIGATGEDATGVQFSDTVDPNTAFVPGSIQTTPLARPDSYAASGNIRITVAAPGVLANDSDVDGVGPAINVTAGVFLSAQGGNVNLSADGSFIYNPAPGFEGSDSFTYTLNDGEGPSDTGTVTITVTGMIWFINNNASCPCDGRLTNPFNTIAAFEAVNGVAGVNNPAANDNIFVYESATAYVGPLTLENNQKFIGQDATDTLSNISGVVPPAGSDPLPATNSGNGTIVNMTSPSIGIQTAQNNTLRGFTGGNAGTDINGTSFGTLNILDVTLNGTGRALALDTGTLAATIASISSATSSTTGVTLISVAGSLTSGSTTITSPTGNGITVNTSSGNFNFAATSVSGGAIGLNLTSNTGPLTFASTTVSGTSGIGVNLTGNSGASNFGNTSVTTSGGTGVNLGSNTGAITFGDLDISPNAGQRGLFATDNTQTITTTSGTIGTGTGTAVEITRASGNTPLAMVLTSVSSSGAPNGIMLKNTSGSFTVIGDNANTTVGGNNTGGTITNSTGADGLTSGNGVYLESAGNVTLRRIRVNGTNQNHGIRGVNSSNFTLEFSTVTGTNGTSAALDEGAVNFDNLTGTAAITSCIIEGGFEDNLNVINTSGVLNRMTISGTTFGFNGNGTGNNNIQIESINAGTTLNFTLKSSLIKGARADFINALASGGSTMDAVIGGPLVADGNTFDNLAPNNHPTSAAGGNRVVTTATSTQTVDIRNNTIKGSRGEAIRVRSTISGALRGNVNARVRNNAIGLAGTANSGSSESFGVFIFSDGGSSMTAAVTNNSIVQYNNSGIHMTLGDQMGGAPVNNITVTGNTVNTPGNANPAANFNAIHLDHGTIDIPADSFTSCIDIGGAGVGNNVAGGGKGAVSPNNNDVRVRQRQATTVRLPGYGGANNDNAAVVAYLTGRNTLTTAAAANSVPTGGGFIGGAACTAPSFAGPITSDESTAAAFAVNSPKTGVVSDDDAGSSSSDILYVSKGDIKGGPRVVKLTPSELTAMAEAAIARWAEAGLSARSMAKIQAFTFDIADLPEGQLAVTRGSKITLDESAAGYGWFFDATPSDDNEFGVAVPDKELQTTETSSAHGRVDLLTVLMRQFGNSVRSTKAKLQGPQAWLMEGTLEPGTRRAPAFHKSDVAKAAAPKSEKAVAASNKSSVADQQSYQQVASLNKPRSSKVRRHHAVLASPPTSFADVLLNIGVLPAGKTITITFDATVDDPFPGPGAQVCNQGTVSGTNFTDVLTDDPAVGGLADPTCTLIDLQADLEVEKLDTPDPVIAGNNITYTINFTNNGPNASGATVTDATPAGTTFVSAAVTTGTGWSIADPGVGNTGNVVFTKALVASGEDAVFQIVVKVASSVAGGSTINNSATAATTGATDPVPGNNTGNASTAVIAQADLSITKTDGATTEIPGTSISYTIVVSNSGPSDANGVSVADTFPGTLTGVTFTSVAAGGATGNTAAGAGNIADTVNMPAGSSITYTVNATIQSSATGELSNTATVTAPVGVTDPNTENNSATDTDTLVPTADLSITKTDGATTEVPGTSVTYTIVATNNGPSDANGVSVADTFPSILSGVTFTSVAAGGATGNTAAGSGNINDTLNMPAGSSVTYTVNATIDADATGELTNTATVTAPEGVTDPTPGNNSATDTDTLTPEADLSITKTDGATDEVPGTSITYTITVTNNGPSDDPSVSVADTFPGTLQGVTFTSVAAGGATGNTAAGAGNIADTVNMPAGSSVTYTVNATIASSATGNLSNTATVTASVTDPTPGNNSATDTDTLTPSADVAVDKTGPATITPGNNISYTITVTNSGPSDAVNLSFVDAVPAGTTFVSVTTPAGWTRTDAVPAGGTGNITFTAASLAAGAPASVFTLVVNANIGLADGTIISNTVTVGSATADPNTGNNSDTFQTTVQNNADLSISKQVAPAGPNMAGSSVTYTVIVTNNGPSPATSVTFSDSVPAGLTVTTQTDPAGWTCNSVVGGNGTITCTKAGMANGEQATLTVVATIGCNVAHGATINNTATVSAASPADANGGNNSAGASFTVNNPAPVLTASVATTQLPQNTHDLLNVGLMATATDGPCGTPTVTVQVFGDEDDQTPTAKNEVFSPDAKDLASGTLRLRAERVNSGDGRVYLIVVKATDAAGQTSFATFTVVVPKSSSPANVASVNAQAAAAKAFADANLGAPPAGYFVIGDGPIIGNKQ